MTPPGSKRRSLAWVHFGDLHITEPGEDNHRDFVALIDEINTHLGDAIDFAYLPGDNANNGAASQYRIIRSALAQLHRPVHIIPGDHDREPGSLSAFYSVLGAEPLPNSVSLHGYRCLFLDVVSYGSGGPDFGLAPADLQWIEDSLHEAAALDERAVLFMHAYPADLKAGGDRLLDLIRRHRILAVDMGHTHYNELGNDGHTIHATTRSTGQIEEGEVGFSIMHLEHDVVSWHFKPLRSSWPFVMITSPADHRLTSRAAEVLSERGARWSVTARAWSAVGIRDCRCKVDDGPWLPMRSDGDSSRWSCKFSPLSAPRTITVVTEDRAGQTCSDSIEPGQFHRDTVGDGSDADRLDAWPEKHLLGTQLGPNRNGRQW